MTNPTHDKGAATALVFKAPPSLPDADQELDHDQQPPVDLRSQRPQGSAGNGALRMLKGARAAAAGMKISDDQIRAVLEDPQDVQPDPNQPTRTRLQRDGVTITTGNDGMILRVTRKR
jgi:hypothetical protein